MILGDNPTGHSFVLRDLVLIELSGHAPPLAWRGGSKISIFVVVVGVGGHVILK